MEKKMQYPPPEELKTNPLNPGDRVKLYESEEVYELHENDDDDWKRYPVKYYDNYEGSENTLTGKGYYSPYPSMHDSPFNVERVISRAEPK